MNILEHPIYKAIYDLCQEIENLPASELQTKIVVMASDLGRQAKPLVDEVNRHREVITWIAGQQNLFFAESSQAEEIVMRCRNALFPNSNVSVD